MTKDQISVLMDGELDDGEARIVIGRVRQDATARDEWEIYHLIGDSLRQAPLWDAGYAARFAEKLAAEPTVLAPSRRPSFKRPVVALSAAASLAAVSLVAWTAFHLERPEAANNKMAGNEVAQNVSSYYLIAHQEYSATPMATKAGIPGASPYQSVSLERQHRPK